MFANPDVYQQARRAQFGQESATIAYRLTGDLRILDRLCSGYDTLANQAAFAIGWSGHNVTTLNQRNVQWGSAGVTRGGKVMTGNPWSPHHRSLPFRYETGDYRYQTDIHQFNEVKHRALMTEFAWALHLNRGTTSPAGHDYAALADFWAEQTELWWQSWSGATGTDWGDWNYRGNDTPTSGGFSGGRAAPGTWPVMYSREGHGIFSSLVNERYTGLLGQHGRKAGDTPLAIVNPDGAIAGAEKIAAVLTSPGGWIECENSHGRPSLLTRGSYGGSRANEPNRSTYMGYVTLAVTNLFLQGAHPTVFNLENLRRLSRSASDMMLPDGRSTYHLGGTVDHCGHGLVVGSGLSNRSPAQAGARAMAGLMVFADAGEPEGAHLIAAAAAAASAAGSSQWWPTRALQFAREALVQIGAVT